MPLAPLQAEVQAYLIRLPFWIPGALVLVALCVAGAVIATVLIVARKKK